MMPLPSLTPSTLQRTMPGVSAANAEAWAAPLWAAAVEFHLDADAVFAAWLASISNESHLTRFAEVSYFHTDVARIVFVFGSARTPPVDLMIAWKAQGQQFFDEHFYNWIYDDRRPANPKLGNNNDGDGYKRRGLGPLAITGGANQLAVSAATGTDFYANPDLLSDPIEGSRAAAAFMHINRVDRLAADGTEDGFLRSVHATNPGLDIDEFRTHHLVRWYEVKRGLGLDASGNPTAPRILRRGMTGDDVRALQEALAVQADGQFGGETWRALTIWQGNHGLTPDGIAGPLTMSALKVAT